MYFYNNNIGYQIKIYEYNTKTHSITKIIGFSDNNLYVGDKDGSQDIAVIDYYNYTMKWYEDKKIILFDTLTTFNNLRYISFN